VYRKGSVRVLSGWYKQEEKKRDSQHQCGENEKKRNRNCSVNAGRMKRRGTGIVASMRGEGKEEVKEE